MHAVDAIGNIKVNTIQEIIHGPALTSIKQHMLEGQWHDTCRLCRELEATTGASARTVRKAS